MIRKTNRYVRDTLWSIKNATNGVRLGFLSERNFRTELAATVVVLCYGLYLGFSYLEFALIFFSCSAVLGAELLNTAIEESWNKLHPEHHSQVGRIKDLASGGVFVIGLGAIFVVLLIFIQYI